MNTGLGFNITANDREFLNALNRSGRAVNTFSNNVISEGDRIELMFNKMSRAAGMFGISFGAKELISNIVQVRNQFQQLEIAFGTMLKSTDKATKLMSELQTFAANTPFGLQSASSGAKQLIAYGSKAEDVIKELTMLGDVASGTGQQIGDLVYLYGTLRMQGRAYLMDIRQFAGRGIPIYAELAKVLGVAEGKVNELVSAGKVGFPEVEQAFKNMTTAGGMYGGLMAEQSKSIGGRWEELKDNIDAAFNSIGKSSEGIIYSSIDGLNLLVANYEKLGKILLALVATYGAYRAAVMLCAAAENIRYQATLAQMAGMTKMQAITDVLRAKTAALNATLLANPYVAVTVVVVGLVAAMLALRDSTTGAEKAQAELNKRKEEAAQKEEEHRNEIEKLITASTNQALADLERTDALEKLKQKYPQIFAKYDIETLKLADILSIKKQIAEIDAGEKVKSNKSGYEKAKSDASIATNNYNRLKNTNAAWQGYDIALSDAKNKMDYANKILDDYESKVQNDRINSFISGINKMTDTQIKAELAARQRLQAEMQHNDVKSGTTKGGVLDGEFNTDQIKQQTDALTSELNKRKVPVKSYIEWEKQYNSDLKGLQNQRKKIEQNNSKLSEADLKKQLDDIDSKIKAKKDEIKTLTGKTKDTSKADESAAEKARKTAQKVLDDQLKLDNDKAKASLDARNQELENQQALLNLQEDGFKKEQKQAEINHQKELLSIDKRAQELIEAKQKAERDAWDIKNPNPKTTYVNKTVSSSDLLLGQQSELNNSRDIANRTQIKANADLLKNLLEKYQDFNTKKIAVDKQYNKDLQALESQRTNDNSESINRSISQLKKQYEESISAINIEELRESIDWQTVFGDIDRVSSQSIENLRSKLKEYASEAGKNLAPTDMKTLTDAIDQLDKKYAELKPNKAFTDSFNDYKAATDNVKRLRQELEVIKSGGNITIGAEYDKESGKMTTVVKTQTQAEKDLTDAQNKRRQSLISLGTALQGYVSKSQQYLDLANETVSTLEAFGVKVPEGVSRTLEGLGQISSGMDDVSKGLTSMNPVLIAQGGIKALGGLANAVQGIFGKRDKAADDTKRLQDVTEKVSVANDAINSLLEKRIELIKESTAAERQHLSVLTNESLDAYQDYYDEQFNRLLGNDLYGKKGKNNNLSVEDVMKMYGLSSPEDFAKWWQSGGYGALTLQGYDLRDKDKYDSWASAYMDMIDKRKELAQTMDEEATQISFDSFRDSFLDTLSDMDSSSKDFAENFEGYLQKAMLNSLLNEKYQDRIKNLYSMFSDYNADGNIDESEYKKLQDYEKQLTDDMIADRDKLKKSFGWDSSTSQSSSYGTSTSMDQETGSLMVGRLNGIHETLIGMDSVARESLNAQISQSRLLTDHSDLLQQLNGIQLQSMYYLSDISKYVSVMSSMASDIESIKKNTNAFKGK